MDHRVDFAEHRSITASRRGDMHERFQKPMTLGAWVMFSTAPERCEDRLSDGEAKDYWESWARDASREASTSLKGHKRVMCDVHSEEQLRTFAGREEREGVARSGISQLTGTDYGLGNDYGLCRIAEWVRIVGLPIRIRQVGIHKSPGNGLFGQEGAPENHQATSSLATGWLAKRVPTRGAGAVGQETETCG